MALAEAMYCGTPAVTFTIPGSGVNWVSLNGETGIEVPNGDDKAYAKAIDTLLGADELRMRYAENARKRVKENFTIPKMVEKMEGCYRGIKKNNVMSTLIPLLNRIQNSIGTIEVKGVPDKLWRVLLLLVIILVGGAYLQIKEWCLILIAIILGLVLILAFGVYLFFMLKNPDYLRSESFQIRKQAIEILGDKDGLLPTDVSQVINVPYTSPKLLENEEENNEE